MPGALPEDQVSAAQFPRLFAWVDRFKTALKAARKGMPPTLSGEEARTAIVNAPYNEAEGEVDKRDAGVQADNLTKGRQVTVYPTDSGSSGKDVGNLVRMDSDQVVIETRAGASTVRLHAPRHGFRVEPSSDRSSNL